ncbi:MAG: hypothetical protein AMXMBFR45_21630 [Gammaproteobacteria bacterium]|nr:hypothetical protein [Gammaproteobacteria bacterium]MDL1881217.1 class I SAM-dependent methyltransferase [Gammaproteobacteria bacterium PRO2]
MQDKPNRWRTLAQGAWDYFRHPELRDPWGGPFNNQQARQALFQALLQAFRPWAIVETGAYRGSTTEYFAGTGLPVFSAELDLHAYAFSRARLWRAANVRISNGDSRAVLREWLDGPIGTGRGANTFFYLDAHWGEDLPLAEEIDLIFARCPDAIVMIDDFEVPGDGGYGFDDYGPGKALNAGYIGPAMKAHGLAAFYPSTPAASESGALRGCVVLAKAQLHGQTLAGLSLLRAA